MINDLFKNFKVNKRKLVTYGFDKKMIFSPTQNLF